MSPRTYRKNRRAQQELEMHEKILKAAVQLHAEHGATGTSFGMIANLAGVSPQTVYNHFPNLGELVTSCTQHVQKKAPVVDASVLKDKASSEERLTDLTAAVYRQLDYLAPWLRLGHTEVERVPELADLFQRQQAALRALLAQAVVEADRVTPDFLDAALTMLNYPAFAQFTQSRSTDEAAALVAGYIIRLLPE
ncbi:TetR/AcrR family transcriptional regulator [Elongatibacter sediminis]|uniref:TetR/AcrR family transcriptional regulator n=1 Tax=Elongatibacter sediminis TaxID=3119006 RepID=A0AAW9RFW3_9GAMM